MAQKEEKEKKGDVLTNLNSVELINKNIQKEYGDNAVIEATSIIDENTRIVPVSPKLDLILGGGIPDGTMITATGLSGCGKTTFALHYASKCQSKEYGDREVFYLDVEGRLKKVNLKGIPNLNLSKFHVIRSHKKKIFSGQEYLQIAENILRAMPGCVVIIDSYSAICHENELTGDVGMSTRGAGGYSIISQFCRQMCNVVPVMKSNVVGITHLMANVGNPHGGLAEKSGFSITYHADIRLKAKSFEPWRPGGDKTKPVGQVVKWVCQKSALGAPYGETEGYIRYGKGIDELYELFTLSIELGLIAVSKAGGWHTLTFHGDQKIQGAENVYELLTKDKAIREKLLGQIHNMMK